jgi:hypothetical protein
MRERVDLVGGVLAVEALRPHGTTVRVDLPLRSEPAADPDETPGKLTPILMRRLRSSRRPRPHHNVTRVGRRNEIR